ncbi:COMM domain-containing protein 2-like [Plodia interpunctella]|uniref:COMM domain-containing protein 2-like n=1 Tax=Plodia interpunctella TaxID=58824 RepID=UPI002368DF62|nr:COMM domain-containing protein 2-like [Plodia interpunctella]
MIIFLSELQKEHLSLLQQHSTQVLIDFCKLSIDYLNNGINNKKYNIAAEKLGVSFTVVQNLVHALLYLIVEACKYNLSEPDFKSSLAIAGFSEEQQDVLVKLYSTKNVELSNTLSLLQQKDPSYQDFTWRFEVQIASRSCIEEIRPTISMDFVVTTPKNFGQIAQVASFTNETKNVSPIHVNSSIQEAKASSHCQNIINHHLLQCDLPNLIHMTNVLEQALKESKSQHVRKVQRAL